MLVPWHVPQPSSFWRRELFERFGPFRTDMHYAFDAEFMLRLAFGDELPELLPDEFLAVRSVHAEQKTFEMTNSWPEIHRFRDIYATRLTSRELRLLRTSRVLRGATPVAWVRWRLMQPLIHYVLGPLKRGLVTPALTWAGDQLGRVPERWRPPIRTRDRLARKRPGEGEPDGAPGGAPLTDRPRAGDERSRAGAGTGRDRQRSGPSAAESWTGTRAARPPARRRPARAASSRRARTGPVGASHGQAARRAWPGQLGSAVKTYSFA